MKKLLIPAAAALFACGVAFASPAYASPSLLHHIDISQLFYKMTDSTAEIRVSYPFISEKIYPRSPRC